ncbi:MAG: glycerophosphodiester phosphodiesterase [Bacteroidales bacterium]|nr:glycerophosphodiester phosphodiesterase [Bacteroidales bacterium]
MKKLTSIILFAAGLVMLSGCLEIETPENWTEKPETEKTAVYKVVAHRGGSAECKLPDCSVASLKYAISQNCYASESDIVLTGDKDILICHPDGNGRVNGLDPGTHTLAEIRAAGNLSNGELIPTLTDFLKIVMDKELNPNGMKLWLDVKRFDDAGRSINACLRASEIIAGANAQNYCEFLIPTGEDIFMAVRDKVINDYKINIAWMTCTKPAKYADPKDYGKVWAQLAYRKILGDNPESSYRPSDYFNAGLPLSIYGADDDKTMADVIPYYPKLKAIFTNYPAKLISKLREQKYID